MPQVRRINARVHVGPKNLELLDEFLELVFERRLEIITE